MRWYPASPRQLLKRLGMYLKELCCCIAIQQRLESFRLCAHVAPLRPFDVVDHDSRITFGRHLAGLVLTLKIY
jgi:hypothetical protein